MPRLDKSSAGDLVSADTALFETVYAAEPVSAMKAFVDDVLTITASRSGDR
jgi:hypothetical protein